MAQPDENVKIDRVCLKTRRSVRKNALKAVDGYKDRPTLDLLAMTSQDVADALIFCETIGIDLEPVSRMIGEKAKMEVFYNYLREYLVALEKSLEAGKGIGSTVALFHPDSCLRKAAEKFGREVKTQQDFLSKKELIEKFRSWVEERT